MRQYQIEHYLYHVKYTTNLSYRFRLGYSLPKTKAIYAGQRDQEYDDYLDNQ